MKRTKLRPGPVVYIALVFVISAGLRIAGHMDVAMASSPETSEPATAATPEDPNTLFAKLKARQQEIDRQELEIAQRLNALRAYEDQTAARLEDLRKAEQSLRETMELAAAGAEPDVMQLLKVYEAMKPKDAAALFDEMDPAFAAGFLGKMRPDAAAAVLAGLPPAKAYTISALLAGRNAETAPD